MSLAVTGEAIQIFEFFCHVDNIDILRCRGDSVPSRTLRTDSQQELKPIPRSQFVAERDERTTSWVRVNPTEELIERRAPGHFFVLLDGSTHRVVDAVEVSEHVRRWRRYLARVDWEPAHEVERLPPYNASPDARTSCSAGRRTVSSSRSCVTLLLVSGTTSGRFTCGSRDADTELVAGCDRWVRVRGGATHTRRRTRRGNRRGSGREPPDEAFDIAHNADNATVKAGIELA